MTILILDPDGLLLFLDLLRERGFKYLAVETLTNWKDRDFVTVINFGDGYYSEEPTFNIFLRLAVEKGFKLIPYENYEACQPFTEEDKMIGFFARILGSTTKLKTLQKFLKMNLRPKCSFMQAMVMERK